MKMTMHIDEKLLGRVMRRHGFSSKTEAVDRALRELERKAAFARMVESGIGASPQTLREAVYEEYDVHAARIAEKQARYES